MAYEHKNQNRVRRARSSVVPALGILACVGLLGVIPSAGPAQAGETLTYKGIMTIAIQDQSGSEAHRAFRKLVTVWVGTPRNDGTVRESNLFNMMLSATSERLTGNLMLQSASVYRTPYTGRQVVLQYWRLTLQGSELSGTLVDTHESEGAGVNMFWDLKLIAPGLAPMDMPFLVAAGATMRGRIDSDSLTLRITGNDTGGTRSFACEVVCRRSN